MGHLEETRRAVEVLEPVLAEVAERDGRGESLGQQPRRLGHHDLAPVADRGDAGSLVDGEADVAAPGPHRLARVEADPHPHLVAGERELPLDRGRDAVGRRPEHDEERVALCPLLFAAVRGERGPEQLAMILEDTFVRVAEPSQQAR